MEIKKNNNTITIMINDNIIKIQDNDPDSLIEFLKDNLDNTITIEDLYNQLNNTDDIGDLNEWLEFDDEFFNTYFKDDPGRAARAVYFGKIQSWNDPYIRFNGYANLETTRYIPYEDYAQEIMEQWIEENY